MKQSILLIIMAGTTLWANDILTSLFTEKGVSGTMIIASLDGSKEYVHNKKRSEKRLLPASTFKIPNSLIALDAGVIKSVNDTIKWDGKDKGLDQWNRDHTMETAFSSSCVWFYQELAKRVGLKKYTEYLSILDYGNKAPGPDVETFWLEGDVAISAREQIDFLRAFYNEKLPFSNEHLQAVKDIMLVEYADMYSLYAKTGWAARIEKQHGWYVGFLEVGETVWLFAMNLDISKPTDKRYRQEITTEAIRNLKLIK